MVQPILGGNTTGEIWRDEDTNFTMYMRVEIPTSEGTQVKTLETTEFITNVAPDPTLFEVPDLEGYIVSDRR